LPTNSLIFRAAGGGLFWKNSYSIEVIMV